MMTPVNDKLPSFLGFQTDVSTIALPEAFTFPFCYQPHQLSQIAICELQHYLQDQNEWHHDFGFNQQVHTNSTASGKMFGVLVVQNKLGQLGYLIAFSGKVADKAQLPPFVPPVSNPYDEQSDYFAGQLVVNQLNSKIAQLEANPEISQLKQRLAAKTNQLDKEQSDLREIHRLNRAERKLRRSDLNKHSDTANELALLAQQSIADKKEMLALKERCKLELEVSEGKLNHLTEEISALKQQRSDLSLSLQRKIFEQYQFLNIAKERQNLLDLFLPTISQFPPAGAGDCAAPKLLQYAFQNELKPISMAEFWWGASPKSEIRQHKNVYPSCSGKCKPILKHMLAGMKIEPNPLLQNQGVSKKIDIIYEDEAIVIINKPAELLSVPGVDIEDSVYSRMKTRYPDATGSLIVHRLDMSTSGLMVIALTARAHKQLQKQFIQRTIKKRYIAKITRKPTMDFGYINLALKGDLNDRPRQLVCEKSGKPAQTYWELVKSTDDSFSKSTKANTRSSIRPLKAPNEASVLINLYPKTGRTHQLRVHCAHPEGLNSPIIGDDLYGKKENRLHLHASQLTLIHPYTREEMTFNQLSDFE